MANPLYTSIKGLYLDREMKYTVFEVYAVLTYLDHGIAYAWNAGYHTICFFALYSLTLVILHILLFHEDTVVWFATEI